MVTARAPRTPAEELESIESTCGEGSTASLPSSSCMAACSASETAALSSLLEIARAQRNFVELVAKRHKDKVREYRTAIER